MKVIIDGIVYIPKENKSELEIIEEKYDSGEYIIIEKLPDHCMQVEWHICSSRSYLKYCEEGKYAKLIHKKHKNILDIYLKDNNVAIEYEYPVNNELKWHNINCDWLSIYNETTNYRIKIKEWYENTDNFPCIVMQVNNVDNYAIGCGYLIFRDINDYDRFGGDYRFPTKEEVLSLLIKEG